MFSYKYFLGIGSAIGILGIYAILWQQILKRISLSTAYMFKGLSLVFVILLAALLFGETITWTNVVGTLIIMGGIALFAHSDRLQ